MKISWHRLCPTWGERSLEDTIHTTVGDVSFTSEERKLAFSLLWSDSHSRLRIIGRKTSSQRVIPETEPELSPRFDNWYGWDFLLVPGYLSNVSEKAFLSKTM